MNLFKRRRNLDARTLDGLVQVRGRKRLLDAMAVITPTPRPSPERHLRRVWEPRGLERVMRGSGRLETAGGGLSYGGSRVALHRYLRDSIPIISAGVWAWTRLTATRLNRTLEGPADQRRAAEKLLEALDDRLLEAPYGRGSGFVKLAEGYFLELFTTGRCALEAVLKDDGKGIDHVRFVDPESIGWEATPDGWRAFVLRPAGDGVTAAQRRRKVPSGIDENTEKVYFDPCYFFYGTLGIDFANPLGSEPLACIPFVSEIEQLMLEDMARSSHNAGTPRLQIKIGRPERFSWEGDYEYTERANRFFNEVVAQFGNLEPDDNLFTWSDVEVTLVGGSGKSWEWRLNREQVIEDVITGLKLFPWVLGRTHRSTQNWVQSQYDLLMQVVQSHQLTGAGVADWVANLELQLNGTGCVARNEFDRHPDPFRLERAQAERAEFDCIDRMVERGYISQEEGKRKLGL
ncbi:MAG: hypothetical protein FJY67_01835 [Calditrichaeota bacterium]|nr:hypothetical protein [Calditrichota bacterium]